MHDPDLDDLLRSCSRDDLEPLVGYLTNRISSALQATPRYKNYYPDHTQYIDEIIHELQLFGGNSIVNLFRGRGVSYAAILGDVCTKLGVERAPTDQTADSELKLLVKILEDSLSRMSPEQRAELEERFRQAGVRNIDWSVAKPLTVLLAQGGVLAGGFLAYQVAVIVANAVARLVMARGLTFAANTALTRALGAFAGPIGLALTGAWTVYDLSGPAYRVTIPCCCHIAYLRQQKRYQEAAGEKPAARS